MFGVQLEVAFKHILKVCFLIFLFIIYFIYREPLNHSSVMHWQCLGRAGDFAREAGEVK